MPAQLNKIYKSKSPYAHTYAIHSGYTLATHIRYTFCCTPCLTEVGTGGNTLCSHQSTLPAVRPQAWCPIRELSTSTHSPVPIPPNSWCSQGYYLMMQVTSHNARDRVVPYESPDPHRNLFTWNREIILLDDTHKKTLFLPVCSLNTTRPHHCWIDIGNKTRIPATHNTHTPYK